jgi:hypothetical protein
LKAVISHALWDLVEKRQLMLHVLLVWPYQVAEILEIAIQKDGVWEQDLLYCIRDLE